jgi:hypothetical protein
MKKTFKKIDKQKSVGLSLKIFLNETQYNNIFLTEEVDNSLKSKQLSIILATNPMLDDYHVGIRKVEDVKTLEEIVNSNEPDDLITTPDWTIDDIMYSIESKQVTIYSSYPIENGVFVSPSKMIALSYSGNGRVFSKRVNIADIAWIDSSEGQFAKV